MDLAVCSGASFASAESPSDVAAPGIAHCVIFAFVTTAYMVSEPLPPQFFLPHGGSAVFADIIFGLGAVLPFDFQWELRLPLAVLSVLSALVAVHLTRRRTMSPNKKAAEHAIIKRL